MLIDRAKHVGWTPPKPYQTERSRWMAAPLWRLNLPAAAPTSSNHHLCIDLDQGGQGSCTANTWAQNLAMGMGREGLPVFTPSRRANYWWNRNLDGNATEDTGATVGGAFHSGADMGVASEIVCPYDDRVFAQRPGPEVDRDAFDRRGKVGANYHEIKDGDIDMIERVLTSGRGVSFGRMVTRRFCSTLPDGVIDIPSRDDIIAGGHAETAVDHNRAEKWFMVKGSYGREFHEPGMPPGCYRVSYNVMETASDLWFVGVSTGGL